MKKESLNKPLGFKKYLAYSLSLLAIVAGLVFAIAFESNKNENSVGLMEWLADGCPEGLDCESGPAHSKQRKDNGDGTYKLSLSVTGDADTKVETPSVNVLVMVDTSRSMSKNWTEFEENATGRYGDVNGIKVNLYRWVERDRDYDEIENDTTTGTVYYHDGTGYHEFTGTRYKGKGPHRSDTTENIVREFAHSLFGYQDTNNPSNIQMSLMTFNHSAGINNAYDVTKGWTSTESDITGPNVLAQSNTDGAHKLSYASGTNYEDAFQAILSRLATADADQTFVVFFTDGAPSQVHNTPSERYLDASEAYGPSQDEARAIETYNTATHSSNANNNNTTLYGIYAFGTEADYLDDVLYFAQTGEHRDPESPETVATDNYYNAGNTAALSQAMSSIFDKIVSNLGVNSVSISDGTTSNVETTTGKMSHLLEIDETSYEYWLTMPVSNTNTITRVNLSTGREYTIRLSVDGDYVVASCPEEWGTTTYRVKGEITGNKLKYKWTEATGLYNYAPPAAEFDKDSGSVDWDLKSLNTLLNDVTYEVTFDVYPSQETYDLIADFKNGMVEYNATYSQEEYDALAPRLQKYYTNVGTESNPQYKLDDNIKKYLSEDYNLETNTVATLTYSDSREESYAENETVFYNVVPSAPLVSSQIFVEKMWPNALDGRDAKDDEGNPLVLDMHLIRDGEQTDNIITVSEELNQWKASKYIATGLLRTRPDGTIQVLDPGHDYELDEPAIVSYHWELVMEVSHPMVIDSVLTTLIEVTGNDIPQAVKDADNNTYMEVDGQTYYKFKNYEDKVKVYVVKETAEEGKAELKAYNYRKSYVEFKKEIDGDAPTGKEFEFTFQIHNEIGSYEIDDDVWFSVYDTKNNEQVIDIDASAKGTNTIIPQYEEDEDGNPTDVKNGYYYTQNDAIVTIKMQDGWNLRVLNLGTESTYRVVENNVTTGTELDDLKTSVPKYFRIKNISVDPKSEGQTIPYTCKNVYDEEDGEEETSDDEDGEDDQAEYDCEIEETSIEGTIIKPNTSYSVVFTNEYPGTYLTVDKTWLGTPKDKVTVELMQKIGDGEVTSTGQTADLDESNDWTYTFEGLPLVDKETEEEIEYSIKEIEIEGYDSVLTQDEDDEHIWHLVNTELTEATVKKVWEDADNQDGKRPTSLTVELSNGESVTLNDSNKWTATIKNLPKYDSNNVELTYTWTEDEEGLPEGYELTNTSKNGTITTLTNSYTPELTKVTVKKVWDDADNQDGKRPGSVTFTLSNGDTITLDGTVDENGEDKAWEATFKDLPKYENESGVSGEETEIEYTVTESTVANYTTTYENGKEYAVDGGTITNKYTPELTKVTVKKVWDDADNQDGKRPDSVTFTLSNGDTITLDGTVDENGEDKAWEATFKDLPKYENESGVSGEETEIEYTVTESTVENYTTTYENGKEYAVDGGTITNKYTPELTKVTVKKVWDDADNQDGKRPDSVTFTLSNGDTITLDGTVDENGEDKAWEATFKDLPKYENESGVSGEETEIEYTVTESTVANYTTTYENGKEYAVDGGTITNKYTPELTKVTVKKVWDDADNQDGKRPGSVTFTLSNGDTITLDGEVDENGEDKAWEATFKDLPKYENESGVSGEETEIEYTVTESTVANYTTTYENGKEYAVDGGTITNKYTPELTKVTVKKVWDDADNQDGKRPGSVTFTLSNGDTITLDGTVDENGEDKAWEATFKDLPKYENESGVSGEETEIEYTVTEASVANYVTIYDDDEEKTFTTDGGTITNKHVPEVVSVTVKKVWEDADNQDGKRPTELNVVLNNGIEDVQTVTLTPRNDWTIVVGSLPKYKDGVELVYTWTEDEKGLPEGYELTDTDINGSITTFTNSYTPEKTTVSVTKTWDDEDNQDGKRPDSVTFTLSNGDTITLDGEVDENGEDKAWEATFKDLPKYENESAVSGEETKIEYTVTESTVANYTTIYEDDKEYAVDGGTITNKYVPETTEVSVTKTWDDEDNQDGKRPDSVTFTLSNGDTITLDGTVDENGEDKAWVATFKDLPKYENESGVSGEETEIEYTVTESTVENYTTIYEDDKEYAVDGGTITNKYTPEKTTVSVTKTWDDEDNQDGKRPGSVTFTLSNGDTITLDGTVDENGEDKAWEATFKDLPKYENESGVSGEETEIEYTVTESTVENYTTIYEDDKEYAVDGGTITNKYVPETTEVSVTKVWEDADNQDGMRPDSVTFTLSNGDTITLDGTVDENGEDKAWEATFKDLPKYENESGISGEETEIEYTVTEASVANYVTIYDEDEEKTFTTDGGTITNIHTPLTFKLSGYKIWKDGDNQDGLRTDIEIKLTGTAKGETPVNKTTTLLLTKFGNVEGWEYEFDNLPVYYKGEKIVYSVDESNIPKGYEKTQEDKTIDVEGLDEPITVTGALITNTHDPKKIKVDGLKKWDDKDNQDGIRPDSVTVTLYSDNAEAGSTPTPVKDADGNNITATATKDNGWKFAFTDLPQYKQGGKLISYSVVETGVDGYSVSYELTIDDDENSETNGDYTSIITNKHIPATVTITGNKAWDDKDNQDGIRPDTITIKVLADGEVVTDEEGNPLTAEVGEATNWSFTFENLPKFKNESGITGEQTEIDYTIVEDEVSGYEVEITKVDGTNNSETTEEEPSEETDEETEDEPIVTTITYSVKNNHTPEVVNYTVTKVWDDEDNNDGIRPKQIIVTLYADGEKKTSKVITEADNWTCTFENLPKNKKGVEIVYTVTEEVIDGYEATITLNDKNKATIINKHNPEKISINGKKIWKDDEKNLDKRPTYITIKIYADGKYLTSITVKSTDNWEYKLDNLYKFRKGVKITYTIEEEEVEGYVAEYDNYNIINYYEGTGDVIPPKTSVDVDTIRVYKNLEGILTLLTTSVVLTSKKKLFN